MTRGNPERFRPSSLATWFVMGGLALAALAVAYLYYSSLERPPLPPPDAAKADRVGEWKALVTVLTYSFLLLLAFLAGSYVMVRVGRSVLARRDQRRQTRYVDAWSSYRLTDEEIESASQSLDEGFPPARGPDDDPDDAPPAEPP